MEKLTNHLLTLTFQDLRDSDVDEHSPRIGLLFNTMNEDDERSSKKRKLPDRSTNTTSMKQRKENDDESDLLASLGSTLHNMDQYEQDVLKTAQLEQAPRLTGVGFPSLAALAPSGRAVSDLPYFQTVLARIRQQLTQQPHNLTLLLQQQMLLNAIHHATNDFELCVRPQEELKHEQLRRQRFQQRRLKRPIETTKQHSNPQRKGNESLRSIVPQKSSLKTRSNTPTTIYNDEEETEATNRLEQIKKQEQEQHQKSVSFADTSIRRRIGLQKRRRNANENDEVDEEAEQEFQQRKEELRKLREEREKRRRKRRQNWITSTSKATKSSNNKDCDDEDGETEFTDNYEDAMIHQQHDSNRELHDVEESPAETVSTAFKSTQEGESTTLDIDTVQTNAASIARSCCPICQEEIQAPDQYSLDEVLSKHLEECQTSRRRTRGQRQSLRRSSAKVVSYAEADEGEEEEEAAKADKELTMNQSKATTRTRRANRPRASVVSTDGTYASVNGTDEDDNLQIDEMHDNVFPDDDKVPDRSIEGGTFRSRSAIDDFEEVDYEDRVDDWIENGIANMRVMKERDEGEQPPGEEVYDGGLIIPAWINDRLFPYQRTGLQWMWELHRQQAGGIVGDEMGLGKTVQISAFLGSMAASRKLKSILIIAPATMLQHWLVELKTWAPGVRRILIHQSAEGGGGPLLSSKRTISLALLRNVNQWLKDSRRHRLFEAIDEEDYNSRDASSFCGTAYAFVTTYENLRRNPDVWTGHPWSYVVMDEAQKIRNPDADITLVCKRLRTPHRLALSGTPIQNDLRELWSLFDFVFPGRLGTLPAFENEFADPIKRGGYSNASPMQVQLAYRCAVVLRDLINPYLLRRLKKDIKEVNRMPGKKEQVLFCRLSNRQRAMYEAFLQSDQVKQVLRGSTQLLGAITMLRKICNHPDLVCPPDQVSVDAFLQKGYFTEEDLMQDYSDDENEDSMGDEGSLTERSGKLEVLAKILPLWKSQGHRVLIFCQWKKMLNIIQRFTDSQGWKFGRLDGNTNVAARQHLVDSFNSDESYFGMLMTTRTGGVGLNLTGADRIILYDPDWNPQTDAQARERAWRFGQEREVTIYRLISAGTVEEKIYQRQIFKTALSNRILQDPRQRRLFSQKDLKDLFSLKIDTGSVIAGSEGLTETGRLTKGEGYIDPDLAAPNDDKPAAVNSDDGETMQSVLRSKGLAGVFDHDLVESNRPSNKDSVREMEENAKKVARAALGALRASVEGHEAFTPTWTGSEETQGGRFGENRPAKVGLVTRGLTSTAGVSCAKSSEGSLKSSSTLLASIRQQTNDAIAEANGGLTNSSTKEYTALLHRIQDFVRSRVPTTDELLLEFSTVKSYDAAVFRRLLKSVATIQNDRWRLKKRP